MIIGHLRKTLNFIFYHYLFIFILLFAFFFAMFGRNAWFVYFSVLCFYPAVFVNIGILLIGIRLYEVLLINDTVLLTVKIVIEYI